MIELDRMVRKMLNRSIGLIVSTAVFWFPLSSLALGLGDLTVESKLASPLNARVVVNGIDRVNIDPESLIIKLDSKISASTPRLFHRVEGTSNDSTTIVIFTRTAVMAPLFEFSLRVEWNNGAIARNYDVMIDPPFYKLDTAASSVLPIQSDQALIAESPISAVESASTTTDSSLLSKLPDENDGAATVASKPSNNKGRTYGPTASGNSLWRIARTVRSDNKSLTMYQWMHGIWDNNRKAFMGANMHRLRVNALLSIPPEQDVFNTSHQSAYQLYSEHIARLQLAQVQKSKVAVDTVVIEAEQPLLETDQSLAAEISSTSIQAVASEISLPVTDAIAAPDQNDVVYDLLAIEEIEGQQTAEFIKPANNSGDIENLALNDDLVTGTDQADTTSTDDLVQAPVSVTSETPVSNNVADSDVSDSAGANDAVGFIANSARGLVDRVLTAPSWVSMILGAMFMLLFVGLVRMFRSNAEPVGRDPVRADIMAKSAAVEAEESSTILSDINDDTTQIKEDLSCAYEPAVVALADVKGLLVEVDVLAAYGNTEDAVTQLLKAIEQHPSEVELGLHLLQLYYNDRNSTSFEHQFRTLLPVLTLFEESEQVLWRWKLSDLCPESPLIYGNGGPSGITAKGIVDSEQTSKLQTEDYLDINEHIDVTEIPFIEAVEIKSELEVEEVLACYEATELLTMDTDETNIDWGIPENTVDDIEPESATNKGQKPAEIVNVDEGDNFLDDLANQINDDEPSSEGSDVDAFEGSEIITHAIEQSDVVEQTSQINMSEDTLEFFGFADDESELELRDTDDSDVGAIGPTADAEIDNTADTILIDQLSSEANTVDLGEKTAVIDSRDYDDSNADKTVEVYQPEATHYEVSPEEVGDTLSFIEEVDNSFKLPDEVPGSAETSVEEKEFTEAGPDPYLRPVNGRVLHFPASANKEEESANEFQDQLMQTLQAMRDQMQQMNERLFSQERENQRLRKVLEDMNSNASINKRDKA
jgi:FimV-like protein